jgi:hypothetical protein
MDARTVANAHQRLAMLFRDRCAWLLGVSEARAVIMARISKEKDLDPRKAAQCTPAERYCPE